MKKILLKFFILIITEASPVLIRAFGKLKLRFISTLLLIIALTFGLNMQANCADEIKYVRREIPKKETSKKEAEFVINDTVNFNHGLKIGPCGTIKQSVYKLNTVFPSTKVINPTNGFPGNRGPGQLVVYMPDWGNRTGTNEFGQEAIVVGDVVQKISGADSIIPRNGFVISGHGEAKTWINNNVKVGTKIKFDEDCNTITAYTTVDSYRYQAREKINELEAILELSKNSSSSVVLDEKKVRAYIKKARQYLKKSDDDNTSDGLAYALASINMSTQALSYTIPYVPNELHGVWIRPTERTRIEIERTFDEIEKAGINAVFVETFYHGKTIFPSNVMRKYGFSSQNPIFAGFDPLSIYVSEAKKRKIQLHIWFESFYIGNKLPEGDCENILSVKPAWGNKYKAAAELTGPVPHPTEHKGYFLDPANPEVITFLNELIMEISARYDISGVNLDYVRYPQAQKPTSTGYEMSNWGYSEYARNEFKSQYGVDPLTIKYGTSAWKMWDNYRQNKIAAYVSAIKFSLKDRGVLLSAVVFPDEESCIETKQQNWGRWAEAGYVDAVTPLILTSDADMAQSMMRNIKRKAGSRIKVYPGIFVGFMEGEPEDLLRQMRAMRLEGLDGAILFDYAHLDKKYVDVLKTCVFSTLCETDKK